MNADLIDQVLAEYEHQRTAYADPALEAVRTAIFVEDVFGITLRDDQIDPAVLTDPTALRGLMIRRVRPTLMCGICGIVTDGPAPDLDVVTAMMGRLGHRGPDGSGYLRDHQAVLGPHPPLLDRLRRWRAADRQRRRHTSG